MTELQLDLDFACCSCGDPVGVTVKCAGEGLSPRSRIVAAVKLPCPNCGMALELWFEPSGAVRAVNPGRSRNRALVSSLN